MIPLLTEEFGGGFDEEARFGPRLRFLKDTVVGNLDETLWTLMATIGILLAVACANVANLVLVRTRSRRQELAIRAALGAGWGGITRVVFMESMLLGLGGGLAGLGVAYSMLPLLRSVGSAEMLRADFGSTAVLPQIMTVTIDPAVVLFTLGISLLAALMFALIPAIHFAWGTPSGFGGAGRSMTEGREGHRSRNVLVVSQVALALLLLVGSGLMIRSFQALRQVDPGFRDPGTVQTFQITIPNPTTEIPDPLETVRTQHAILDQLSAVAGVESAGFVAFNDGLPLDGDGRGLNIRIEGRIPADELDVEFQVVSPNFFETTQTPLAAGRTFHWNDIYDARSGVIISENLARAGWGSNTAALGKRITVVGPETPREVIGVVADVRHNGISQPAPYVVAFPPFVSLAIGGMSTASFVVRSARVGTPGFLEDLREAAWSVNPNLSLANVQTLSDMYQRSIERTAVTMLLLLITGAMSLVLGLVGIYGVVSYAVSQRNREIGIRMALGAGRGELEWVFVKQALVLVGIGIVTGLGTATGLTRLMASQLFGVRPLDPLTYIAVALVLLAGAGIASYLPARRASAADPAEVLNVE